MMAGKLDRRVEIYRAAAGSDDGYTVLPGAMTHIATRWSRVLHQTGREAIEAAGKDGMQATRFHMRWDSLTSTLTELDELEHDGKRYAIVAPPNELGRREGVELTAESKGAV